MFEVYKSKSQSAVFKKSRGPVLREAEALPGPSRATQQWEEWGEATGGPTTLAGSSSSIPKPGEGRGEAVCWKPRGRGNGKGIPQTR